MRPVRRATFLWQEQCKKNYVKYATAKKTGALLDKYTSVLYSLCKEASGSLSHSGAKTIKKATGAASDDEAVKDGECSAEDCPEGISACDGITGKIGATLM